MPKARFLALILLAYTILCQSQVKHSQVKKYHTHLSLNGNKVVHKIDVEIQINTPKGTNDAEVEIYSTNKPKDMNASIEDVMGNEIRSLKKKDIEYSSAYSGSTFHTDGQITSFSLIHNKYPHILKYSYSIEYSDYVHLINWIPNYEFDTEIEEATLSAVLPAGFKFRIIENHIDTSYITNDQEKDLKTYNWVVRNPQKPESEKYSPPIYTDIPRVEIIPENFHYGIDGSTQSWMTYGNWHELLNQNLDELIPEEKIKVHQLVDPIDNPREKIKALYHYLQDHTRYINVSLELGGLCPHPASYVCQNKYGDCKALTNYMKSLLKEAGIPSLYSTIYSSSNPIKVQEEYPSQQFNHVILCVPQKKDSIWLECTSSTFPFNYIGTSNQGRKALIIEKDNSRLISTPSMTVDDCYKTFTTKVEIKPGLVSEIETTARIKGKDFEFLKDFENYIPESQQADIFDRLNLMRGIDVQSITISRPNRDSCYLNLQLTANVPNMAEHIGSKTLIRPLNRLTFNFEKPEKRKQQVTINTAIARTDTVFYHLADNITKFSGIKAFELETKYGYYKRTLMIKDNTLNVTRDFVLYSGIYTIEEYNSFYKFIEQTNQHENQKLLITH